jgi:NADH:ubiquinone oxidoreductase subunit 6 (subunit J)
MYFYTATMFDVMLLKQLCLVLCLIFIVIPAPFTNFNLIGEIIQSPIYESVDSLLAIKEILYEHNTLYLIISVIGLLIALIGSAVFTRGNK